ncbi:hypothetical protein MXB_2308 [Myxobolus squamalis]|nr:hypothetical protein MXB_2308 [Myxobolus squamalis]
MNQALIMLTDETLLLLRYNGPAFIDSAFRIAPTPFIQCLVVMYMIKGTNLCPMCIFTSNFKK